MLLESPGVGSGLLIFGRNSFLDLRAIRSVLYSEESVLRLFLMSYGTENDLMATQSVSNPCFICIFLRQVLDW